MAAGHSLGPLPFSPGEMTHSGQAEASPDPNAVANAVVKGREFSALASRPCLHTCLAGVGGVCVWGAARS